MCCGYLIFERFFVCQSCAVLLMFVEFSWDPTVFRAILISCLEHLSYSFLQCSWENMVRYQENILICGGFVTVLVVTKKTRWRTHNLSSIFVSIAYTLHSRVSFVTGVSRTLQLLFFFSCLLTSYFFFLLMLSSSSTTATEDCAVVLSPLCAATVVVVIPAALEPAASSPSAPVKYSATTLITASTSAITVTESTPARIKLLRLLL